MHNQSGVALVIVLWMLILLTIIAVAYSKTTRTETTLTTHFIQSARARMLAEAGIWIAVNELLKPNHEQLWEKDGSSYKVNFYNNEISLRIQDESGKIDLNSARSELLFSLLESLEAEVEPQARLNLLQSILDWRDRDNLVRQFGAEDNEYKQQGLEYGAKDGPFNSVDELQLIMGMNRNIFTKLQSVLTIHSHQPGINPEVAPREVLLALPGITPETTDAYITTRSSEIRTLSPEGVDPRYFSKGRGNTFTITSIGHVANVQFSVEAVVAVNQNSNPPYSVLSWSENNVSSRTEEETGNP